MALPSSTTIYSEKEAYSLQLTPTATITPTLHPITIVDPIYGTHTITEPALIAIIQSDTVQRLKSVTQHGISAVLRMLGEPVTRYDHSIGAMLCCRVRGKGDLATQVAALLHDIAHTSLSHVADTVFNCVIHEEEKIDFLASQPGFLPLLKHHFPQVDTDGVPVVLHEERYPLLEQDPPSLCADRMDYGVRDALHFSIVSQAQASRISQSFIVHQGKFVMDDLEQALLFSRAYMKADEIAWSNPTHSVLYKFAAETIRLALDKGLFKKEGMWELGDYEFWERFVQSADPQVRKSAQRVRSDLIVEPVNASTALGGELNSEQGLVLSISSKTRTLDPDVKIGSEVKRLTELDGEYAAQREAYIASKKGERRYRVRLPAQ